MLEDIMKAIRCGAQYFCFGALLIFVGSILLISLGLTVVLPYEATKDWPKVNCTVIMSGYNVKLCSCSQQLMEHEDCIQSYPCLQVYVSYTPTILKATQAIRPQLPPYLLDGKLVDDAGSKDIEKHDRIKRSIHQSGAQIKANFGNDTHQMHSDIKVHSLEDVDTKVVRTNSHRKIRTTGNKSSSFHIFTSKTTPRPHNRRRHKHFHKTKLINVTDNQVYADHVSKTYSYSVISSSDDKQMLNLTLLDAPLARHGLLYRSWGDAFYNSCSIHECGVEEWNVKESLSFKSQNGQPGMVHECYYNPHYPWVLVLERVSHQRAVHAVLWPALCLGTGFILWLGLWLGCYKIEIEDKYKYPQRTYGIGLNY